MFKKGSKITRQLERINLLWIPYLVCIFQKALVSGAPLVASLDSTSLLFYHPYHFLARLSSALSLPKPRLDSLQAFVNNFNKKVVLVPVLRASGGICIARRYGDERLTGRGGERIPGILKAQNHYPAINNEYNEENLLFCIYFISCHKTGLVLNLCEGY